MGVLPLLKQITCPSCNLLQPDHAHEFLLYASIYLTVILEAAATEAHVSPVSIRCVAQVPSASADGVLSGRLPELQHTY
jgi:hypothetical protein